MLCPNEYRMLDLNDVTKSKDKIIVGVSNGQSHVLYEQLKATFPFLARTQLKILHSLDEAVRGYRYTYHIYFDYTPLYPLSPYIAALSEACPSHVLTFKMLNSGDFFVKDHERPFYNKYHQYAKGFMEKSIVQNFYPYLAVLELFLYVPTIKDQAYEAQV